MGKTRRKYTREFKLSIIRELESGVSVSEISREYNVHPALPGRWKNEYYKDPDNSFSGNGNTYKLEAKNAELERLIGQLYAENEFLKRLSQIWRNTSKRRKDWRKGGWIHDHT